MATQETYERPSITTIPASRILEMMGPVSAGSSGPNLLPIAGGPFSSGSGGGFQNPGAI